MTGAEDMPRVPISFLDGGGVWAGSLGGRETSQTRKASFSGFDGVHSLPGLMGAGRAGT